MIKRIDGELFYEFDFGNNTVGRVPYTEELIFGASQVIELIGKDVIAIGGIDRSKGAIFHKAVRKYIELVDSGDTSIGYNRRMKVFVYEPVHCSWNGTANDYFYLN